MMGTITVWGIGQAAAVFITVAVIMQFGLVVGLGFWFVSALLVDIRETCNKGNMK